VCERQISISQFPGRCTIEIEGKAPVHLKTGDVFIIETGAKGIWTVHEAMRKYYVFALGQ